MPSILDRNLLRAAVVATLAATLLAVPAPAKKKVKKSKTSADRAEIEGKVVSSEGDRPIEGAQVILTGAGGEQRATSDAKGSFEVAIADAGGVYTVRLEKAGFASFESEIELEKGQRYALTFALLDEASGRRQSATIAYNEGATLYQEGEYAAAKAKFLAAAEAQPDLVEAQLGLANVYLGEDDLEAAASAVERFRAARPDDAGARRLAFEVYLRQGDLEGLAPLIESYRGSDQAAGLAAVLFNRGVAALSAGEEASAVAFFEAASDLGPDLAEPIAGLATIYYNREDYAALAQTLERLDAVAPDHPRGHRLRFLMHDARGEIDRAMAAFDAYRAVEAEAAVELLYKRADIDFREGRNADARRALERILESDPDHARAHFTLGLVLASADDVAGARRHLERFLTLAPDDPDAETAREMLPHLGG